MEPGPRVITSIHFEVLFGSFALLLTSGDAPNPLKLFALTQGAHGEGGFAAVVALRQKRALCQAVVKYIGAATSIDIVDCGGLSGSPGGRSTAVPRRSERGETRRATREFCGAPERRYRRIGFWPKAGAGRSSRSDRVLRRGAEFGRELRQISRHPQRADVEVASYHRLEPGQGESRLSLTHP